MIKRILLYILFISLSAAAQAIGPRVTIPQLNYSFTNVPQDSSFEHTYMIYNGGGGMLTLGEVKTSCKCITATLDKNTLSPTDSARLVVSYTNIGRSSSADNYVSIKTNDENNPNVRIYITRVVPTNAPTLSSMPIDSLGTTSNSPVIYFPVMQHDFGKIKQGTIVDYTFKYYNKGGTVLTIKNIQTSCGCTAAVVKDKNVDAGKEGEIRVQFDSTGKSGKLVRQISVMSNDPKNKFELLKIYADVEK